MQERCRLGARKIESTGYGRGRHGQALQFQPCDNGGGAVASIQSPKQRALARGEVARAAAPRKKNASAAEQRNRRVRQDDGMIAGAQRQRPLQAHLHHTRLADREGRLVVQKHNATEHLGRARHHVHARARGKNAGSRAVVPHICQPHQKAAASAHATLDAEHLAALEDAATPSPTRFMATR